jgi:hypothetical protein
LLWYATNEVCVEATENTDHWTGLLKPASIQVFSTIHEVPSHVQAVGKKKSAVRWDAFLKSSKIRSCSQQIPH